MVKKIYFVFYFCVWRFGAPRQELLYSFTTKNQFLVPALLRTAHHYQIYNRNYISQQGRQYSSIIKGYMAISCKSEIRLYQDLMRHPTQLAAVPTDFSSTLAAFYGQSQGHRLYKLGVLVNQQLFLIHSLWLGWGLFHGITFFFALRFFGMSQNVHDHLRVRQL